MDVGVTPDRNCVICDHRAKLHFERRVLGKYLARYFHCTHCQCVFVADPHWLPEAYHHALNVFDTGAVARNVEWSKTLAAILFLHCGPEQRFVDFAGGYGLLARIMRDIGFDYFWEDRYAENLFARGFEANGDGAFAAMSAFEVFEHLPHPVVDLAQLASRTDTIVFSTLLWANSPPRDDWWYYGFEHGQHVVFYSRRTLEVLAAKLNYHLVSNGTTLHVFTRRPDTHGVLGQLLTKHRVRRSDLTRQSIGNGNLRLPAYWLTGPSVSMRWIDHAIRRSMASRTGADHDLLKARFSASASATHDSPGGSPMSG